MNVKKSRDILPPVSNEMSSSFYALKALAIWSVVSAHMPAQGDGMEIARRLLSIWGTVGVVVFMILAGFFYKRSEGDALFFWRKKFFTVVVPWFLAALITFVWLYIRGGVDNMGAGFVRWFLGSGTWFYFCSVICFCFAWFKYIYMCTWGCLVSILLTVISIGASAMELVPYNEYFTPYLNPFNWIGFFALGILARRYGWLSENWGLGRKNILIYLIGATVLIGLIVWEFHINYFKGYFSLLSALIELTAFCLLMPLAILWANNKMAIDIGKKSFAVYLYHMPVAGFLNVIIPSNAATIGLKPLLALLVVYGFFKAVEVCIRKTRFKFALDLLGLR